MVMRVRCVMCNEPIINFAEEEGRICSDCEREYFSGLYNDDCRDDFCGIVSSVQNPIGESDA